MTILEVGKLLETIGAVGLAYVGVRAAVLEVMVGRHLHDEGHRATPALIAELGARLEEARRFRQRQFGPVEAVIVGAGAALIALGCALYLFGMMTTPHG